MTKKPLKLLAFILFVSFGQVGCSTNTNAKLKTETDGEWTTMSGKVKEVSADSFLLETAGKTITVEMDDGDWDADGYKLVKGDRVTVSGKVDKGLFEKNTLEAGTVYVKNLNTHFFASPGDEEGDVVASTTYFITPILPDGASVEAQGKVTKVMKEEFILDTGVRKLTVEVDEMGFNPLDDKGLVKIQKGDSVRVSGIVDDDFLEGKELEAMHVLNFN